MSVIYYSLIPASLHEAEECHGGGHDEHKEDTEEKRQNTKEVTPKEKLGGQFSYTETN